MADSTHDYSNLRGSSKVNPAKNILGGEEREKSEKQYSANPRRTAHARYW